MTDAYAKLSNIAEMARTIDRDRFLCTLFAPAAARDGLYALLAFNGEIAKSREMVSEGLLGEIRLQWWRDALERIYANPAGDYSDHAILAALAKQINRYDLSRAVLDQLIDARAWDMLDAPPEDIAELRRYAVGTAATLNALMMTVLRSSEEPQADDEKRAVEHVGVAWAVTGILRASSVLARYKRLYIPQSLMREYGFEAFDFFAQKPTPAIQQAVAQLVQFAEAEIAEARALMSGRSDKRFASVFLQASLAALYLKRIRKFDCNPFAPKIETGRAGRQLKLTFRAVRGSF